MTAIANQSPAPENPGGPFIENTPPKKGTSGKCLCLSVLAILVIAWFTWSAYQEAEMVDYRMDERRRAQVVPEAQGTPETQGTTPATIDIPASELRLPTTVSPINYDLTIKTYLPGYGYEADHKNMTFEGHVDIKVAITDKTKVITMNTMELEYVKAEFYVDGRNIGVDKVIVRESHELVDFYLEKEVDKTEEAVLKVTFHGKLRTDMTGLYQTSYPTKSGIQKLAAVTQMEPTYTRRMLPCFDEPAFRATWTVTVIHPIGTVALANGIEESSESHGQFVTSKFKTTPSMSSYLLAIFVSEFQFNEGRTSSGVRFRVWSRPEELESTKYAVFAGVKCLEFFEKYFNISFPLEKQDMVALPDFSMGAMENWGLITYRETMLLYTDKLYDGKRKRSIAAVIAHELVHQWFGNLVTLKWWNDLWLNEGFATLVEYIGTDEISDKNFRMEEYFPTNDLWDALRADSVSTTHPMTFKIDKAIDVLDSFDPISYSKGGSVLRMIRKAMGEEYFNKGLYKYLKRHEYGNAEALDLFRALGEALPDEVLGADGFKLNVTEFAEPWTKQLGYPIVTTSRINKTHLEISQERFKLVKSAKDQQRYSNPVWKFKWDVPIWYQKIGGEDVEMTWLRNSEPLVIESRDPIILNADSNGLYRGGYSEDYWKDIITAMSRNHLKFSTATRIRLIDDAFTLASAGSLSYRVPLELISYLKNEKEYLPWSATLAKLREIVFNFGTDPEKEVLYEFTLGLAGRSPARKSIDFVAQNYKDDKVFFEVLAAQELIFNDCKMHGRDCSEQMAQMFHNQTSCDNNQMLSECSRIPAPFRYLSYCHAVRNGNHKTFEKVFNWYKIERNQMEKAYLMDALACSKNVLTLKTLLINIMKPEGSDFRLQDCSTLFRSVASNPAVADGMLNFLITRWDQMLIRLSKDRRSFNRMIGLVGNTIKTREGLEQFRKFRKTAKNAESYQFDKVEESIEATIEWREKNLKDVIGFVKDLVEKN